MGKHTANISRDMYEEEKRYQMLVHQQGVPWVEADENDRNWIFYNLLRRLTQKVIGNGSLDDGFKIVGTGAANDFTITGGNGTPEGAGRLLVEGFQCILPISRSYKGSNNLECTPVSTGLTGSVLTDSAANLTLGGTDNNLAGRTLVPDITKPSKTYTVTANTKTTITISGNMLSDGIQAGAHYRVDLSTPNTNRIDEVYIDCYLDEIDGEDDPQIKHTLGMEIETQRRLKLIQNVLVAEGATTPASYPDSDGNQHYTLKLAAIQRYAGQAAINAGNVTDVRVSVDTGIIDAVAEVMAARGGMNSLNARLNVFLNNNGSPKPFPIGTRMIFYQATVPTGWVQVTGINDRVLRFVDGVGGGISGSWIISGLSSQAAGEHWHATGDHTLTVNEMPSHKHDNASLNEMGFDNGGVGWPARVTFDDGPPWANDVRSNATTYTGGGVPHNHGNTGSAGSHSHTLSHDGNWRPAYANCVVGEYRG
ncbi:MAG: hypothetical protein HZA78_08010 [Candidatus Schekmanbacteria bacterium]|nr:hypothetical protein [Candidatus Schekmanbacteria bacterium]